MEESWGEICSGWGQPGSLTTIDRKVEMPRSARCLARFLVLPVIVACISGCGGDSESPVAPSLASVEALPVDTIFTFDTIFGPDDVTVRYHVPAGCNRLRDIEVDRSTDQLRFTVNYEFFEPCDPERDVEDPTIAWHAASTEDTPADIEYSRFSSPGRYFLVYRNTNSRTVSIPITVLAPSTITNVRTDPPSPATLGGGERIDVTFDYSTPVPGGVGVFPERIDESGNNLIGTHCASPGYPAGKGSGSTCFFAPPSGTMERFSLFMVTSSRPHRRVVRVPVAVEFTFNPK